MWHVKVKSGTISKQSSPFHLFLSGSRSCGKSYLIETVFHAVSKAFFCRSSDPDKPRVLLILSTEVAAINISSNAVHSGLHIPDRSKLFSLNDANNEKTKQ